MYIYSYTHTYTQQQASQLSAMSTVRSGGAPSLFGLESHLGPDDVTVKDYAGVI